MKKSIIAILLKKEYHCHIAEYYDDFREHRRCTSFCIAASCRSGGCGYPY